MSKAYVYGFNILETLTREAPHRIVRVFVDPSRRDARVQDLKALLDRCGLSWEHVSTHKIEVLAEGGHHQGVVAEVTGTRPMDESSLFELVAGRAAPFLCVLENIQDPRNLGACLRTAEAVGVDAVVLPRHDCCDITPVVRQASAGAAELVPVARVSNLVRVLNRLRKDAGLWVVGTAGEAERTLYEIDLSGPMAMVFGSEGRGLKRLTQTCCDHMGRIPMTGKTASLNVSVAVGIGLFEVVRQRMSSG
jgi:23S rRNA (guanosine2251-2'-O)-methyltransferase